MIDQRSRGGVDRPRRAHDVLDDYDRGGVLSEQLADELCNELVGLGPRTPARRTPGSGRRTSSPRPGPQPSRPAPSPASTRPRLTLVRGD